jgi:uncharacterized protein (DUF2249 family)
MNELDVRALPPREKHPTIMRLLEELPVGETLRIVNDHDPQPLRTQLERRAGDAVSWAYVERGPDVWRVDLGKRAPLPAALPSTGDLPRILRE